MAASGELMGESAVASTVPARANDEIDLREIFALVWRGRLWIVVFGVVFGGLAATHAFLSERVYRSEALLAVRSEQLGGAGGVLQGQLGGLASLVGLGSGGAGSNRQEFIAYLKSRALAKEFVERFQLMQLFYASDWDPKTKTFRAPDGGRVPTVGDAVDLVTAVRAVDENARTGLLTVSFDWTDPQVAARWVKGYVDLANEKLRDDAIQKGRKSVEYLQEELGRTTLEPVRQSLYRIMEGRLNQVMLATVEPEYAFRVIDAAEASEPDKFVRPRRAIEMFMGTLFGLLLGTVFVLWRYTRRAAAR